MRISSTPSNSAFREAPRWVQTPSCGHFNDTAFTPQLVTWFPTFGLCEASALATGDKMRLCLACLDGGGMSRGGEWRLGGLADIGCWWVDGMTRLRLLFCATRCFPCSERHCSSLLRALCGGGPGQAGKLSLLLHGGLLTISKLGNLASLFRRGKSSR